jgi:hypothetical protein
MNSSISGSDDASAWGRCLAACLGTLALGALLLFAVMIAVDPYDSGRFGLLGIQGVDDWTPITANASRARDPQFNAAIIGDSTSQRLDPARLSQTTGEHFVQLAAPGTDPSGHLAILNFFIRHHRHIGAIVIVVDDPWCVSDPRQLAQHPFPFWLYDDSTLGYAAHLFSWRALDHAFQRIMLALDRRQRYRPDGFFNYEEVFPAQQRPIPTQLTGLARGSVPPGGPPFAAQLGLALATLPADVPVVLLSPPTFYSAVPRPGSREAMERQACNAAFRSIVADRPLGNFLDYRIDNDRTRDPANFVDLIHYRGDLADRIEQGIAASIRSGKSARIDF